MGNLGNFAFYILQTLSDILLIDPILYVSINSVHILFPGY